MGVWKLGVSGLGKLAWGSRQEENPEGVGVFGRGDGGGQEKEAWREKREGRGGGRVGDASGGRRV